MESGLIWLVAGVTGLVLGFLFGLVIGVAYTFDRLKGNY